MNTPVILNCEQGSREWHAARLGIPTASQVDRILTPKTRKPSSQSATYRNELLAEWLMGEPLDMAAGGYLERGRELEAQAVLGYELERGVDTSVVGFVFASEAHDWGCSPDRLVGDDGLLEVKVPKPDRLIGYHLAYDGAHDSQIQAQLLCTGRAWCDLIVWHPTIMPFIRRIYRDDAYIVALSEALRVFTDDLRRCRSLLREAGHEPLPPRVRDTSPARLTAYPF